MTGRPAETWRLFRFATPSVWVILLLLVLVIFNLGGPRPKALRASGHLPLSKSAMEQARLVETTVALLPLSIIVEVAGIVIARSNPTDPNLAPISQTMMVIGLVLLLGFIASAVLREFFGLGAKVLEPPLGYHDQLVELRRVHPAFVAAVIQTHQARAAQYASMKPPTSSPAESAGST